MVALGNSTLDGSVIFGKNSDREPNEAHEVVIIPAARHIPGENVKCTYIDIPQVSETYSVLLAKPFWIWGAEMGSNEFGVTIGNEAVFTRTPYGKKPGLIGMDFLRLALERSKTASEALRTIIDLLEHYGQGGNCGFAHKMYYHNSFLICDYEEGWILETSGRDWAAVKVTDVGSISNAVTIEGHWDMASKTLVSNAIERGWCRKASEFSFAACYSEPIYTRFSDARKRQVCTSDQLKAIKGRITPEDVIRILRSHHSKKDNEWSPARGLTGSDVCMHAGWGPARGSQTAGSMVSVLNQQYQPVHWVTGTAAPCTSIFKPVWLDAGVPDTGVSPSGEYDQAALYWRHEELHREILRDYATRIKVISESQQQFEKQVHAGVKQFLQSPADARLQFSTEVFRQSFELESNWLSNVRKKGTENQNPFLYKLAWKKLDREAKLL